MSTELPIAAEAACRLAQKPSVFKHVVWPVFAIRNTPERLEQGEALSARLYFLGFVPAWKHHLRLAS
ncbi:MAG TPA: hypothetical protein VHT29_14910, partial [Solirubrobacteraceae bacterium]|nr:hypothetical protein [Solirubrobacteraceae bacterium]